MSKDFKIICFKSIFNIIALCVFVYGYSIDSILFIMIGGLSMVFFSFILYGKILNPLIAIVLAILFTFMINPWYFGVFWAVGIFSFFQIISFLYNLSNKSDFLREVSTQTNKQ